MDVGFQEPFEEADSRRSDFEWERARPRIYFLYIVQRKTLQDVMDIMRHEGFVATSKAYTIKLKKWDYHKNVNRQQALQILREDDLTSPQLTEDRPVRGSPNVPLRAVEAYIRRNKLTRLPSNKSNTNEPTAIHSLKFEPSNNQRRLLGLFDCYIRQSFAEGTWQFHDIDRLIESSIRQTAVKASIHSFVSGIDEGCQRCLEGDYETAGSHWRHAFQQIDDFILDTYHGIFPNVVQMLCDLKAYGFPDVANMLLRYIACRARILEPRTSVRRDILTTLEHLPLDHMSDFEERMLEIFLDAFEWHLGSVCYNSFVMLTDHAKRRLLRNEQLHVPGSLPDTSVLDRRFGRSDRRPMDVLRVSMELSFARRQYVDTLQLSRELIGRASLCHDDLWLRLYFQLHAYYLKGFAEESRGRYHEAGESWRVFLSLENDFVKLDPGYLFEVKRVHVKERLDRLVVGN